MSVFKKFRVGDLSRRGAAFWTLFWIAALGAVLWPHGTTILANLFGIGRGTDFVLYVAIAVIFMILFRLHIKTEQINRDITKVVREKAVDVSKEIRK